MFRFLSTRLAAVCLPLSAYAASSHSSVAFKPGVSFENRQGQLIDAESRVKGRHVLLYFSASWCPPCRRFTPKLKEFYDAANRNGKVVEVVFVSSDTDETEARSYLKEHHGDWCMVPFDSSYRMELKKRYGIWAGAEREVLGTEGKRSGIPTLILIDAETGEELDFMARERVEQACLGIAKGNVFHADACVHSFEVSKKMAIEHRES